MPYWIPKTYSVQHNLRSILFAIWNKHFLKFQTNIFCNFRQRLCYCLMKINKGSNLIQRNCTIWNKYILQFQKYISQFESVWSGWPDWPDSPVSGLQSHVCMEYKTDGERTVTWETCPKHFTYIVLCPFKRDNLQEDDKNLQPNHGRFAHYRKEI